MIGPIEVLGWGVLGDCIAVLSVCPDNQSFGSGASQETLELLYKNRCIKTKKYSNLALRNFSCYQNFNDLAPTNP